MWFIFSTSIQFIYVNVRTLQTPESSLQEWSSNLTLIKLKYFDYFSFLFSLSFFFPCSLLRFHIPPQIVSCIQVLATFYIPRLELSINILHQHFRFFAKPRSTSFLNPFCDQRGCNCLLKRRRKRREKKE
jgi:hypothetical protein